jgi:hypothetical protein
LEPLLYPSGSSFYRPFSYRQEYLSDDLATTFKSAKQTEQFLTDEDQRKGIFGINFDHSEGQQFYERFIPLRLVTLTEVQVTDEVHLFFQLGDYVPLSDEGELKSVSLAGMVDINHPQTKLIFGVREGGKLKGALDEITKSGCSAMSPAGLWGRFISDPALSPKAIANFTDATVLRLLSVTARGENKTLLPNLLKKRFDLNDIRENRREGRQIFGYELKTGRIFDFQFAYSRLVPSGREGELLNAGYEFGGPAEQFDISRTAIPITGNYRYEDLWIKPKRGQPAVTSLDWYGMGSANPAAGAKQVHEKLIGIRVPILVHGRFWTAERVTYAIFAIVFGIVAYFFFSKAYELGSILPKPDQPPSPLIAISTAIGAFSAGTAGGFLQSLAKAFIEDRKL